MKSRKVCCSQKTKPKCAVCPWGRKKLSALMHHNALTCTEQPDKVRMAAEFMSPYMGSIWIHLITKESKWKFRTAVSKWLKLQTPMRQMGDIMKKTLNEMTSNAENKAAQRIRYGKVLEDHRNKGISRREGCGSGPADSETSQSACPRAFP